MKVHAIYDRENKFVAAFPDRDSAESFGMDVLGLTNGWQYSIVEKYLHEYPTLFSTTSLDKSKESELLEKLIWDKFVIDTKELDDDFKEVLYDNLWDLYVEVEE